MKKMSVLAGIVFLAMVAGKSFAADDYSDKQYRIIGDEWRDSILQITPGLESQEITSVVNYVSKSLVLAKSRPILDGLEILEPKKKGIKPIFLVPMINKVNITGDWDGNFFSPAYFAPSIRSIVIDGNAKFSFAGRAIVLAREYFRAYAIMRNLYPADEYWELERDAQSFQNKFLWFLGGQRYVDLVYGEVDKLVKKLVETKEKNFILFDPSKDYDPRLVKLFGQPASREEILFIQRIIWIHSVFILIERTAKKGKAGEEKVEFIKIADYYRDGKNLQATITYPDLDIFHGLGKK